MPFSCLPLCTRRTGTEDDAVPLAPTDAAVPAKVHYIWLGGEMPERYWDDIVRNTASYLSGYSVTVWTSSVYSESGALSRLIARATERIKVLDISLERFTDVERRALKVEFESLPRNYGAMSDIIRAALLDDEGGIYVDTDCGFLQQLERPFSPRYGFWAAAGHPDNPNSTKLSNCVLASVPGGQYVRAYRQFINDAYTKVFEKHPEPEAAGVYLRGDEDELSADQRRTRMKELTLLNTGPSALAACALGLTLDGDDLGRRLYSEGIDPAGESGELKFPGAFLDIRYDNSWVPRS